MSENKKAEQSAYEQQESPFLRSQQHLLSF